MSSYGHAHASIARRNPLCRWLLAALVGLCAGPASFAAERPESLSPNEQAAWNLEADYWKYVKAVDLEAYRSLWHKDFVGWPYSAAQPVRKDHITDWISAYADKGVRLQWYSIQPAASQATENVVVTHYWVTTFWADKAGRGEPPQTSRITHAWIKTRDGWQIIGGMSAIPTSDK